MTANILWLVIIFSIYDILWLFSTPGYSLKILKCFSTTIPLQFLFSFSKLRRGCLFSSVDYQFPVQLENHNWDSTWKQGPWFLRITIFSAAFSGSSFFLSYTLTPWELVGGIGVLLVPCFTFQVIIAPFAPWNPIFEFQVHWPPDLPYCNHAQKLCSLFHFLWCESF